MVNRVLLLCAVVIGGVLFLAGDASAQYSGRDRPQYGTPNNPYLDYFQPDANGIINPNYRFVRQGTQAKKDLQQLESQVKQQGDAQKKLSQDFKKSNAGAMAPTGNVATFMTYGHYYPGAGGGGRR